jgi:uncharacterized GH25 family protein
MKKLFLTGAIVGLMVSGAHAQEKTIPHYRKSGGVTLICQEIWGANYDPCDQVPLAMVKKIDELAKDECENPYVWHFDADGYRSDVWKPVTR